MGEERVAQVNVGDGGIMALLMELQRGVTSVEGKFEHLEEQIVRALEMRPEVDTLKERVLTLENAQKENIRRQDRFWNSMMGFGTILVTAMAGMVGLFIWCLDHFRLR